MTVRTLRTASGALLATAALCAVAGCGSAYNGNGDSVTPNGVIPGPQMPVTTFRTAVPHPDAHCTGACINPGPPYSEASPSAS